MIGRALLGAAFSRTGAAVRPNVATGRRFGSGGLVMSDAEQTTVVWFRKCLRIEDNAALASRGAERVVAFIFFQKSSSEAKRRSNPSSF